jgi:hypothetical protein
VVVGAGGAVSSLATGAGLRSFAATRGGGFAAAFEAALATGIPALLAAP